MTRRFRKLVDASGLPAIRPHDVRHSYATAGRNAKIDWKALSERIRHSDVAFTMRQRVQTDLEVRHQVATTLAELILGGLLSAGSDDADSHSSTAEDRSTHEAHRASGRPQERRNPVRRDGIPVECDHVVGLKR